MAQAFSFRPDRNTLAAAIFFALIAAPGAGRIFLPPDTSAISEIENRAAAPWPAWPNTIADLNEAPRAIDAYLEDRFGFRERLIAINQWLVEQASLAPGERKAVIGEDGWLFYADGRALDLYTGRIPFKTGEAAAWLNSAAAIEQEVNARGGQFVILFAPQKASVYGEYLPDHIKPGRAAGRLQILEEGARATGLAVANPLRDMLAKKDAAQLYYRSDSHWTGIGAYQAYLALIETLANIGVAAPKLDDARLEFHNTDFSGDLARMLNQRDRFAEIAPQTYIAEATDFEYVELDEFVFGPFKTKVITTDAVDKPSLLVIGDSYAEMLMPFLRESFSRIVFTHHQLGAFDRAVLDKYPSDVVVLEMVERMLTQPLSNEAEGEPASAE